MGVFPNQSPSRMRLEENPLPSGTVVMATAEEDATPILIITKLPDAFFTSKSCKSELERMFQEFDNQAIFAYLKSFSRARVTFNSSKQAKKAKIALNRQPFCNNKYMLYCYYARTITIENHSGQNELMLPQQQRNFLISPPTSPPFGWEQIPENEPVVNYDLLRALANLNPDEPHEFQSVTENSPSIVVNVCEDPPNYIGAKGEIPHTKCPDRSSK